MCIALQFEAFFLPAPCGRGSTKTAKAGRGFPESGQKQSWAGPGGFAADGQGRLVLAHTYELHGNVVRGTAVFRHSDHRLTGFGQFAACNDALDLAVAQ